MLNRLIENLLKLTDNCILPNAFDLAHEPHNVVGIWWYRRLDGLLEYAGPEARTHSNKKYFQAAVQGDAGWVKGRIIRVNTGTYLVLYIRSFTNYRLTETQLLDLFQKLEKYVHIDFIVDEDGCEIES